MNKEIEFVKQITFANLDMSKEEQDIANRNIARMMTAADKDLESFCTLVLTTVLCMDRALSGPPLPGISNEICEMYKAGLCTIIGDELE